VVQCTLDQFMIQVRKIILILVQLLWVLQLVLILHPYKENKNKKWKQPLLNIIQVHYQIITVHKINHKLQCLKLQCLKTRWHKLIIIIKIIIAHKFMLNKVLIHKVMTTLVVMINIINKVINMDNKVMIMDIII